MTDELQMPHKLTLSERKSLTMTGVTEVVSFDENMVILRTSLGTLVIQGEDLQLKSLAPEGGQIAVDGTVTALTYEQARASGGWFRKVFG